MSELARVPTEELIRQLRDIREQDALKVSLPVIAEALARLLTDNLASGIRKR